MSFTVGGDGAIPVDVALEMSIVNNVLPAPRFTLYGNDLGFKSVSFKSSSK